VIVAAERVARYVRPSRIPEDGERVASVGKIIQPSADDPDRSRNELGRARPARPVSCHIIHVAVSSRGEPREKPNLILLEIGAGDADRRKPRFASPHPNIPSEPREIGFMQ